MDEDDLEIERILALSDEDVLEELRADGELIDDVVERMRAAAERAIVEGRRRRLALN